MNTTPTQAASTVCRLWVRGYTRKLPDDEAQRRREEIESDLFEHAVEAQLAGVGNQRFNAEVLARVLVGVPADLSWRRATRQPHTRLALGGTSMSLSKSTSTRLLNVLGGIIAVFGSLGIVGFIVSIFVSYDDEPGLMTKLVFSAIPALSAIVLVAGLAIRSKNPRRGLHLMIAGAIGPAIWFWFLPFYLPFLIGFIALAVSVTPRKDAQIAAA